MRQLLLFCALLLLNACDFKSRSLLSCETRFGDIGNDDQPLEYDLYNYDTTYSYDIGGAEKSFVDDLRRLHPDHTFSYSRGESFLNITIPEIARENALETGCAMEHDQIYLAAMTFGAATEKTAD